MYRTPVSLMLTLTLFVGGLIAAPATAGDVDATIRSILRKPGVNPATSGIVVLDVETGEEVFSHNPTMKLTPASVMKIFTSAAALHYLSPEYRFKTEVHTTGPIDGDGVLKGDLVVKAGGDGSMVPEQLYLLARRISERGLRTMTGRLIVDTSRHETKARPDGWPENQFHRAYSAPQSAASYRYNSVSVIIDGVGAIGSRPRITLDPPVGYFDLRNEAKVSSRKGDRLGLSVLQDGDREIVHLTGTIGRGHQATHLRSVHDPARYFGHALLDLLEKEGVTVNRDIVIGPAPEETTWLTSHASEPLSKIVRILNLYSNNVLAETLLREIGAEVYGTPGTLENGIKAVAKFLEEEGLPVEQITQVDGSGLSHGNDVSARVTVGLLQAMHERFDIGPEFMNSLAVSGAEGTLRRRFESQQYRQIRGKTGTVRGAITLAGYLRTESERTLAYAIYLNGVSQTWNAREATDEICIALCAL